MSIYFYKDLLIDMGPRKYRENICLVMNEVVAIFLDFVKGIRHEISISTNLDYSRGSTSNNLIFVIGTDVQICHIYIYSCVCFCCF